MLTLHLEFGGRFPWIRRHRPVRVPTVADVGPVHKSWVMTKQGIGFLDHHTPEGFAVQLVNPDSTLAAVLVTTDFRQATPDEVAQ